MERGTTKYFQVIDKNKKIGELLANDSFIRWIEGTASSDELLYWQDLVEENSGVSQLVEEARFLHQQLRFGAEERDDLEEELFRLNQALDNRQIDFERGVSDPAGEGDHSRKVNRRIHTLHRKRRSFSILSAAAILIAGMMISGMVYFLVSESVTEMNTQVAEVRTERVETDYGETRRISFSDGSVIVLNANTQLIYSIESGSRDVEVELNGEAWFDIAQSENRTVSVHTPDGRVQVLGTKFNVHTYRGETLVILEEGKVEVALKNPEGNFENGALLAPGYMARLAAGEDVIRIDDVDTDSYTSWTENRLRLNETTLSELEARIHEIYGLNFHWTGSADSPEGIKISGSLPTDNLTVLLNALEGLLGRSATIQDQTIVFE